MWNDTILTFLENKSVLFYIKKIMFIMLSKW